MLDPRVANQLVGVIDLIGGRAVHAIAGNRDSYRSVDFCDGDPLTLARHYQTLGLNRLYVADLDAISGQSIQTDRLDALLGLGHEQVLIDVGWRGDASDRQCAALARLSSCHSSAVWIGASESCRGTDELLALIDCVAARNTLLGLDYRQGVLLSHGPSESDWIDAASRFRCAGAVILDVSAVGTSQGPVTTETCRRFRASAKGLQLFSGGGVRSRNDAQTLIDAGCDGVLTATALYPDRDRDTSTQTTGDGSGFELSFKSFD